MEVKIYNLIILDESGSMYSIKKQAVDGLNETVQTIRAAKTKYPEQTHLVSLVTFNGAAIKTIHNKVDIREVSELDHNAYHPDCSTPLYDAMGMSLVSLQHGVKPEDKVLVTIITDGEENSSKEYNAQTIKKLVEDLKSKGWIFAYIGANQDVEQVASRISITNVMSFNANEHGTASMFATKNTARSRYYEKVSKNENIAEDDFFKEDKDENVK
jgi:Mg-chelatase subunit ChlD